MVSTRIHIDPNKKSNLNQNEQIVAFGECTSLLPKHYYGGETTRVIRMKRITGEKIWDGYNETEDVKDT